MNNEKKPFKDIVKRLWTINGELKTKIKIYENSINGIESIIFKKDGKIISQLIDGRVLDSEDMAKIHTFIIETKETK